MFEFIKRLLVKETKPVISPNEFGILKEQFVIVRSRFPSAEEIDIDTQLRSLAIEISTMQRFLDFISLLAYTLETEKTKPKTLCRRIS